WAEDRTVTVSDVIGLTRAEASELLGVAAAKAWRPDFAGALDGGTIAIARPDTSGGPDCDGWLSLRVGEDSGVDAFLFKGERVAAGRAPPGPGPTAPPRGKGASGRGGGGPAPRPAGPLPLEDGVARYVSEASARALPPATPIRIHCNVMRQPPARAKTEPL